MQPNNLVLNLKEEIKMIIYYYGIEILKKCFYTNFFAHVSSAAAEKG